MTNNPCECYSSHDPNNYDVLVINYCPTHANAFKMREALEVIRDIVFDGDGMLYADEIGKDIAGIAFKALREIK